MKYAKKIKGKFFATSHFVQVQYLEVLPSTPAHSRKMPEIWENINARRVCNIASSLPNPDQRTGREGTESRREEQGRRVDRRDSNRMG